MKNTNNNKTGECKQVPIDGDLCMYVRPIALNIFFLSVKRGRGVRESEGEGARLCCSLSLFSFPLALYQVHDKKMEAAISPSASVIRLAAALHFIVSLHAITVVCKHEHKGDTIFTTDTSQPFHLSRILPKLFNC